MKIIKKVNDSGFSDGSKVILTDMLDTKIQTVLLLVIVKIQCTHYVEINL